MKGLFRRFRRRHLRLVPPRPPVARPVIKEVVRLHAASRTDPERIDFRDGSSLVPKQVGLDGFVKEYMQKLPHLSAETFTRLVVFGGERPVQPFFVEIGLRDDGSQYIELLYTREQFDAAFFEKVNGRTDHWLEEIYRRHEVDGSQGRPLYVGYGRHG